MTRPASGRFGGARALCALTAALCISAGALAQSSATPATPSPAAPAAPPAITAPPPASAGQPAAPASVSDAAPAPSPTLASLDWLQGCWHGTVNQREFREQWLPQAGGMMIGAGQTVMQGRTQD